MERASNLDERDYVDSEVEDSKLRGAHRKSTPIGLTIVSDDLDRDSVSCRIVKITSANMMKSKNTYHDNRGIALDVKIMDVIENDYAAK